MTSDIQKALKVFADLGVGSGPDHETETYQIERGAIRNARAALELKSVVSVDAVLAELMDRRLLNDVDSDLHQEIAEAVIKAAQPAVDEDGPLSIRDLAMIDQAWENHKAALPVATVVNDNQPGRTAIIEITIDPPTLPVGTKLYAGPKMVELAAETSPGDVVAMKEALARAFCVAKGVNPNCLHQNYDDEPVDHTDAHGRTFHFGWRNQLHLVDAAMPFIDRLDVKAEAKSQEPEAVAIKPLEWVDNDSERVGSRAQTILGEYVTWISEDECCYLQLASQFKGHPHGASIDAAKAAAQSDYEQRIRSALIHPTTKPEAPAVGVDAETIDAVARIIDPTAWKMEHGYWMERAHAYEAISKATAIAALIAGGR